MQIMCPLEPGRFYHVYNRGVNRANIFFEERNYPYFLSLFRKYVSPFAETFAYCLLCNHFHLFIRIRTHCHLDSFRSRRVRKLPVQPRDVSHAFNNLLNAYSKAINKAYGRTGALFQHHFGRTLVESDRHFQALAGYIHRNPETHGLVHDFRDWPYSSYHELVSWNPMFLEREAVWASYGGVGRLRRSSLARRLDLPAIADLIGNDM